jgi:hypothetical protein
VKTEHENMETSTMSAHPMETETSTHLKAYRGVKRLGAFATAAALFTATPLVGAEPLVSFADLPESESLDLVIEGRPASIPADAKVEGFTVRHPNYGHQYGREPGTPDYAMIFGSKEDADAHFGGIFHEDIKRQPGCFEQSHGARDGERLEWSGSLQTVATVIGEDHAVQPLRAERIKETGKGRAVLDVALAWIDAKTTGAKLISKHEIPLRLVHEAPNRLRVYAYRTGEQVHYVLAYAEVGREHDFVDGVSVSDEHGTMSSSQALCPAHAILDVKKGAADTALVRLEAILPPKKSSGPEIETPDGLREMRARPMFIGLSSSWLSSDGSPVLSITQGWAGRERSQFM